MRAFAIADGRRAVGGGTHQWMHELHPPSDPHQPGVDGRPDSAHLETQRLRRALKEDGIALWLRGSGEDKEPGIGRKLQQTMRVALLDLSSDGLVGENPEAAGEL